MRKIKYFYRYSCSDGEYYYAFWSDAFIEVLFVQPKSPIAKFLLHSYA